MKNCEKCGAEFKPRQKNRANRFCSSACYNASGRPIRKEVTAGTRMRRAPGHPLAPSSGTVAECRLVLYDTIGPGEHGCTWCGVTVAWMPGSGITDGALIADHLDWNQQNNDPGNLVPSCHVCNAHRTREGDRRRIESDELYVIARNGTRHRAVRRACEDCGQTFVAKVAQIRVGKARFCSRSCARRTEARAKKAQQPSSSSA